MEAAREAMQRERAERLKAIQLEVGGDEVRNHGSCIDILWHRLVTI